MDARPSDALNVAYRCKVDILPLTAGILAELLVARMTWILYFAPSLPDFILLTEIVSYFTVSLLLTVFFGITNVQIPVLVSKQIVYEDAIRVNYGFGRVRERKSCYDVLLDR